jgi:hypothetical protein
MARQAAEAVRVHRVGDRARVQALGIHELDRFPQGQWRVAYSNLGPLTCVPDLDGTARAIARRLEPGGVCVASVIGRTCPWEWALYGMRGRWARVRVRYAAGFVPVSLEGRTVWTQYLTPSECAAAFSNAGFALIGLRALALTAPPPYLDGFCRRHPRLLESLIAIDDVIAGWPAVRHWGDHFLMELQRS